MATLPIRSVVSESLLLLLMCYDLLQHKESEQHAWREGIERYPLIPFVSELENVCTIFVNLGLFRHFEIVTNMRTWIKSHIYWRML